MKKTELMKLYEETTYLDDDPQALIQIIEYLKECIQEYKAKADAYDRLMSGVWHSGKERPTKNGWYCAVYSSNIISNDGISTRQGKDELRIVQFYTKRDVWSYWFTNTRGRQVECSNVPKKWMAIPNGWEEK